VQEAGKGAQDYSKSTIVSTSAPTEMGALRKADGQEGFTKKVSNIAQSAVDQASSLVSSK